MSDRSEIPGWEGSIGPGPRQYGKPHVYARDIHSGAGNCVCGKGLGAWIHVQAAPGVPIPDSMRFGPRPQARTLPARNGHDPAGTRHDGTAP